MKEQLIRKNFVSSALAIIVFVFAIICLWLAVGMLGTGRITTVESGLEALRMAQFLVWYLLLVISTIIIANKTNTNNSWLSWLPIGQQYLWVKIAGYPGVSVFLLLLPIVNIIFVAMIWNKIALKLGIGKGMGIIRFWIGIFISFGFLISLTSLKAVGILIPIDLFIIGVLALKREDEEAKAKKRIIRSTLHFIIAGLLAISALTIIFVGAKSEMIFKNHAVYCENETYKSICYGRAASQTGDPNYCGFLKTQEDQRSCLYSLCLPNPFVKEDKCQEYQSALLESFKNQPDTLYDVFKRTVKSLLKTKY